MVVMQRLKSHAKQGHTFERLLRFGIVAWSPCRIEGIEANSVRTFFGITLYHFTGLKDAVWLWKEGEEKAIRKILAPIESLVSDLPKVVVKDGAAGAIAHGAPLMRPGIVSVENDLERGDLVRLLTLKGELVSLGSMLTRTEMIKKWRLVKSPARLGLLPSETYPKAWKKAQSE